MSTEQTPARRKRASTTNAPEPGDARLKSVEHITEDLRPLARPITSLARDPRNARHHGVRNLDSIRSSLLEHGQVKPIVVRDGIVIAGNGTLECATQIGWEFLAVVEYRGADEKKAGRFAVQDNRSAELAEWNDDVLRGLLDEYRAEGDDDLGFSAIEFDRLFTDLAPPVEDGASDVDGEWASASMPEFDQPNAMGSRVVVNFKTDEDRAAFAKLLGQPMTAKTRSMWFPPAEIYRLSEEAYVDEDKPT